MPQLLLDGMCCLAARFLENDDLTTYVPHLRGAGAARLKLAREQSKSDQPGRVEDLADGICSTKFVL